jgi:O-methyltransferase
MQKFINAIHRIVRRFGFEIVRYIPDLPSSNVLFSNFKNLVTAYEHILKKYENANFQKNALRTSLLSRLLGTPPAKAYFVIEALTKTKNVNGDVCEFGVAQGETSALIANEIKGGRKTFHLFDSFMGLSSPTVEDTLKDDIFSLGKMKAYEGTMSYDKRRVSFRLQAIHFPATRYIIHEGFIEDVLNNQHDLPKKVSFAYLDFDLYAPTKMTLEFLDKRTQKGSIIIVDDYDFFSAGVKKAVDEFAKKHTQFLVQIPHEDFGHFAVLENEGA